MRDLPKLHVHPEASYHIACDVGCLDQVVCGPSSYLRKCKTIGGSASEEDIQSVHKFGLADQKAIV